MQSLKIGEITAKGGLNLRDIPSSSGEILLTIPNDETIDLIVQENQWYKTTYHSTTGWVSANYVKIASATPGTDITINGTVLILVGPGVISTQTQNIIEGKDSSTYPSNRQDFPPLPSGIKKPDLPSRGTAITPPTEHQLFILLVTPKVMRACALPIVFKTPLSTRLKLRIAELRKVGFMS